MVGCDIFSVAHIFIPMAPSQAQSERRARWTACKDAAGRQTRRATSDRVAHYRRGVFRSLSVPNVFYSDVLSFRSIYRALTRRHRKKNTRDPKCLARSACRYLQCSYGNSTSDRKSTKVNDIGGMVYYTHTTNNNRSTYHSMCLLHGM